MILLMSSFVTHDRPSNRHNRLDILMMTLKSYSALPWKQVHLYLKLDQEFLPYRDELQEFIEAIFSESKLFISWNRLEYQAEWVPVIERITKSREVVWFTQNDDHPFVDINTDLIIEGEQLLRSQLDQKASVYLSHWPEVLRLSGKSETPFKSGNFIGFRATLLDSIQIFTPALLRYIFIELDWQFRRFTRIDTLLMQRAIWGESGNTDLELQTVYVPLREQCRKFVGYRHVNMKSVSPLIPSFDLSTIDRSPNSVKELILARHKSRWTQNNNFKVPKTWIAASQDLYRASSRFTESTDGELSDSSETDG